MNYHNNDLHIPSALLIQYHKMGFKLVPIGYDGVTPNVGGLLTQEDREISIHESKSGKEEPLNYICNHPEFWNKERIEREAYRFINVATLTGKTHLKAEDCSHLYLNALDIDSEQVFTILSCLSDSNGNDFYFLDKMCKSTFVSSSKKRYGRHIFWLSNKQYKPIRTSGCKLDYEFEIKTDNSQGLMSLPPSRHRSDSQFHYQSIGLNKIQRFDQMYDNLLDTLEDCLKLKDYTNRQPREDTNQHTQINLNDDQIEFIYELLSPYYRRGYRHHLIYGLSGLLHRYNVVIDSSTLLIQKLSIDDEEQESRLLILNTTYQKASKEVSGYQYLLSILENVTDDQSPTKEILKKIISIISVGHADQDAVTKLTDQVMTEYTFRTMRDNEEIWYYDIAQGLYVRSGDSIIREYVEILNPKIKTHTVNEIIQKIRRRTYVDRDQFDNNPDIINIQNGLLDIWTGQLEDHSPDFLSIVQLPLIYDPGRKCPTILRFLGQVLHPQDVFTSMEFIGYLLYRSAIYEKAVMLYGTGDNGKGVFIRLIEAFAGQDNCSHVPLQALDNDKFSSADLFGKVVNTFADLTTQKLLATGNFKTLVSGDTVRAQKKYGQPFSFRNYAKLIFSSNRIPDSDDKSYAYFKRWLILSFERVFQGIAKDTDLIKKLTTSDELSGLLNLAIIALRQLRKDGGFKDISVEKVRKEYEYNANTVKAFLDEKCVIDLTSPEYCIPTVYLYNKYKNFCQAKGVRPLEMNVFGSKLKEYGIEKDRIRSHGDREYYYFGVKLRSDLRGQNQSLF
jgi:P4 family phage/plasmid primase-like protien